ncbi:flagellar basal body-associated FliL family protein [Sphingomonas sp. C3-2]|uniref:flagellar basal body-associated FliL family protein n=1 Tax=Sphingomonas sp. C3-2 TaxID=3062169 RepID=UPI00294AA462|nr:flagellar basal body-associated FliL family protein [Sphingomonas sp. C3-2]WOK37761.1 flagellar basal body-associated FliL family protein [Sphingomonas sp. C3-2]
MSTSMTIETGANAELATPAEPEPAAPARRFDKRKAMIAGAAAILLLGAGGGGYMLLSGDEGAKPSASGAGPEAYVEVPPLVVNLRSSDGQARFLKLRFIIVADEEGQVNEVRGKLPFILDALQPFLRELRPEDLNGSAAVFRVKEEMMARMTATLGANMVRDVLIQDLVQQ